MKFEYIYTRLNVSNYEACKQFYNNVLGFEVLFADDADEYAEFDTGKTLLTIFNREKLSEFVGREEQMTYDPKHAEVALSFRVHDLDAAIKYLKGMGVTIINLPWSYPDRGFISACFRDPDGNLIELEQLLS